jgi:hypothetical protein
VRRLFAYLLGVPLALAGELVAHQGAYFVVYGSASSSASVTASVTGPVTGHSYFSGIPMFLYLLLGVLCAAFALDAVCVARGHLPERLPMAPFVTIGPLAFMVQEHLEQWVVSGHFSTQTVLEPTFGLGLLFQIPTALAAYLVAAALLRPIRLVASFLHVRVAFAPSQVVLPSGLLTPVPSAQLVFIQRHFAHSVLGRAPPLGRSTATCS